MDTLFFWISKLAWLVIAPGNFLLILLLISCVLLFLGKDRTGRLLLAATCVALVSIALFSPHRVLFHPLDTRFETNPPLPPHLDGIIVLSGSEDPVQSRSWNQVAVGGTAERNLTFMAMARKYPEAKLVFSGGNSSLFGGEYTAADVARTMFEEQGLDVARVIFEREARNTYENALLSKKLVQPREGETWLLITTAWHMPRSVGIFCKLQWPVIPYPVDHATNQGSQFSIYFSLSDNLRNLNIAMREWIGLAVYYVTDKTTKLFPTRCD